MTKAELVNRISINTGVEKATSLVVVESLMNEIRDAIIKLKQMGFSIPELDKFNKNNDFYLRSISMEPGAERL